VRSKDSLDNMLRALDGQEAQLDDESLELLRTAKRINYLRSEIPAMDASVKEKIWNESISFADRSPGVVRPKRYRYRIAAGLVGGVAVILAAILAVVFMPSGNQVAEGGKIARLQLSQGEIRILSTRHEERLAVDGDIIRDGDSIIASPETRGIVEYDSGSIMRLEGEAEVVLATDNGEIETEVIRGKSYHRVVDGAPYTVSSHGVRVVADGTAFTFEIEKDTEKVVSLESSLQVEILAGSKPGWKSDIKEGEGFFYQEGGQEGHLAEVSPQDLNNDWLRWNKNLDKNLGLPLGVLAKVEEEDPAKEEVGAQPQTSSNDPNETIPVISHPGREETSPAPVSPDIQKTLVLSGQTADAQVSFSWTLSGYSNFQGFKLFRSETNTVPSYPDDWWKYVNGMDIRSTLDSKVQSGHTYFYRLGVYDQGFILGCSNVVQITVAGQPQELEIVLAASQASGQVGLSWTISGTAPYDGFKICRSQTNPQPSYPAEWVDYVTGATAYTDSGIKSGGTYHYRVGIYRNGSIIKYSNPITVIVP